MKLDAVVSETDFLRFALCPGCGHGQASRAPHCERCGHRPLERGTSAGCGTILTFTTVYRAPSAAFRQQVPYTLVLVDMDEGFRLLMTLHGTQEPTIGQRVRVVANTDATPMAVLA